MRALAIHAGPAALRHVQQHGLLPQHIGVIPAAAGGPKGLMLLRMDQFLFGDWLTRSSQPVHLVGASIGAWRMATACLPDAVSAFQLLEHNYIHEEFKTRNDGRRKRLPPPAEVSAAFERNLQQFYGGRVEQVLAHPRYRLHVVAARGRRLLARERAGRSHLGYLAAYGSNAWSRNSLSHWLDRVVFSSPRPPAGDISPMPFDAGDFRTHQVELTQANFMPALQASGSIPFVLEAVHDIPGAPAGAYWDGGITDYHLHLRYLKGQSPVQPAGDGTASIVLYPHFQQAVVPGWLDKSLRWRHASTDALDHMLLLAPNPEWVRQLPNGKLPDRNDFRRYIDDHAGRVRVWSQAVAASQQLVEEFAEWLEHPDPARIQPL